MRVTFGSPELPPLHVTSRLSRPDSVFSSSLSCDFSHQSAEHKDLHYQCEQVQPTHFSSSLSQTPVLPGETALKGQPWTRTRGRAGPAWRCMLWLVTAVTGGTVGQGGPDPWEKVRSTRMERWIEIKEEQTRKHSHDARSHLPILFEYLAELFPTILLNPHKPQARLPSIRQSSWGVNWGEEVRESVTELETQSQSF